MAFSFSAPRFTEEDEIRELAAMTDAEREEVCQDLYGTHVEREETPELRERSLEAMQQALNDIPVDQKEVYLEACQVCPELVERESPPINFLRCEDYNPEVRVLTPSVGILWLPHVIFMSVCVFLSVAESCSETSEVLGDSANCVYR